ncbi:MAG TPA: NAD(P)-dependent oxidoreductase [Candidatus Atribacteria bacterium]|nr:NAD(P)-dependent oxidoreductase [Candidatus Atribacteria bacterium]
MERKKVLVAYSLPEEDLCDLREEFDVTRWQRGAMPYDEVLAAIPEYDGVLAAGIRVDREIISRAGKLKAICVYGAGYDNVDIKAATEHGIVVANIPDTVTESTAELAIGLMLAVMRRITECDRKLRQEAKSAWGMYRNMGYNLYGKELGIIGMGRIGKATARRAAALGMRISYYNRRRLEPADEAQLGAAYKPLDELLETADVVSIHTPLSDETYHLIGERELSLMKPEAFIINTSRGAVIDEKALAARLCDGALAGAGLDVFEWEPRITPELLTFDNVVLTPHIGTNTHETRSLMNREACRALIDLLDGRRTANVINPEVL